jgi:hypothetical protein
MGVSVRMSRNTRVYLPFWLAVPVGLCVFAGWVVFYAVIAIPCGVAWAVRTWRRRQASP